MVIIVVLIIVLFLVVENKSHTNDINENCKRLEEQGAFLEVDYRRNDMIRQDIMEDWRNEKKMFPEEYVKYLEMNPNAFKRYVIGLISKIEIEEGLQPQFCVGVYNKNTYVPFSSFHYLYDEKIKIYNETGKYYY